nr:hypothetical protein P410_40 [uncultured Alphaproteobacteria bacterium]
MTCGFCRSVLSVAALILCTSMLVPPSVRAQSTAPATSAAPARIGNIWGNLPHQPTQKEVGSAEQESGVAPAAKQQQQINDELQSLDRELLDDASKDAKLPKPAGTP